MDTIDDAMLGARMRELRKEAGLSCADVAQKTGFKRKQILKYEKGINRVSAIQLFAIARAVGAAVASYFEDLG
ncbi:MAG: helix-turn-helix transcriptional regulator [Marinicaulis sp.]|nr:helix-turn-helix transcriptional regulator [Marinicaulis sp.]